jgi:hypothetical protein
MVLGWNRVDGGPFAVGKRFNMALDWSVTGHNPWSRG